MRPEGAIEAHAGEEILWLLPQRAAYWPRRRTLLVADAHLGKAASFRRAGFAVPRGSTSSDLERLSSLALMCGAEQIVFLGDLVHDAAAREAATEPFVHWRMRHRELALVLVRGNHDRRGGALAQAWGVASVEAPYAMDGLALCHEPQPVGDRYAIAGHLHPGVVLSEGRDRLRLPCFWFTARFAVMPAFGAFTGLAEVLPAAGDRVYVNAGERVLAVC